MAASHLIVYGLRKLTLVATTIVEERNQPRAAFMGHTRETKWDQLHRLYFASYALWNYLAAPFLLAEPGVETTEIEPHIENGENWRRLHAKFPASIPTHSSEQIFYFDSTGLLRRHDYTVDIMEGAGANYCYDHKAFEGIIYPTLRRVVPRRNNVPVHGITAVLIQFSNFKIKRY